MVSPFVIVFMVFLILLPMVYGVLMRPARFAHVSIESENRMLADRPAGLFLLNKTDNEFVLWDPARRQVLWIPKEGVKGARVEHIQFLFSRQ
jgi:Leu/Phe-tRNA-protein transferase